MLASRLRYVSVLSIAALGPAPAFPQNRAIFENDKLRVVLARNVPGQKSRLHKHATNRVMIHLDAGYMTLTGESGDVRHLRWKGGDVRWDPAGGLHVSENAGATSFRIIEVELRNREGGLQLPPPVAPYTVAFENDQVRVLTGRLRRGYRTRASNFPGGRLLVFLDRAHVRLNPRASEKLIERGAVRWQGPGSHSEANLRGKPLRLVVIEPK